MPSLDARVTSLEKAVPTSAAVVDIIHFVGMKPDGSEPDPMSRADVCGQTIVREPGETVDAFCDRARALRGDRRGFIMAY